MMAAKAEIQVKAKNAFVIPFEDTSGTFTVCLVAEG